MAVYPDSITLEMLLDGLSWSDVSADQVGPINFSYGIMAMGDWTGLQAQVY
jgi:hypothetical protein